MAYTGAALQQAAMNSTNYYRNYWQADPVSWNDTLASYALNYSSHCKWKHSGGPFGENIANGYGTSTLAIDGWAVEELKYNFGDPGYSEATGHFTQLVWRATKQIGCGATQCNSHYKEDGSGGFPVWFLVCEYFPPGNVIGYFTTEVMKRGESEDGILGFAGAGSVVGTRTKMIAVALLVQVLLHSFS